MHVIFIVRKLAAKGIDFDKAVRLKEAFEYVLQISVKFCSTMR